MDKLSLWRNVWVMGSLIIWTVPLIIRKGMDCQLDSDLFKPKKVCKNQKNFF